MSKTLFLCGTTHGQQLTTFKWADKFRKALQLLLAKGVEVVLEEWDHYGNIVLKSAAQVVCEKQGIHWEGLGLPNDAPTFGDILFDPPIAAEFDDACLVPLPENLTAFFAGRPIARILCLGQSRGTKLHFDCWALPFGSSHQTRRPHVCSNSISAC